MKNLKAKQRRRLQETKWVDVMAWDQQMSQAEQDGKAEAGRLFNEQRALQLVSQVHSTSPHFTSPQNSPSQYGRAARDRRVCSPRLLASQVDRAAEIMQATERSSRSARSPTSPTSQRSNRGKAKLRRRGAAAKTERSPPSKPPPPASKGQSPSWNFGHWPVWGE